MNAIAMIEAAQIAKIEAERKIPEFDAGDTVRVHLKVQEGTRERIQAFEGVCIARRNAGVNSSFTIRKISYGEGVERVFPVHSPAIWEVEVVRKGIVRRAKLYYLRDLRGKAARIVEDTDAQRAMIAEQQAGGGVQRREKLKKEKPRDEKNVRNAKGGGRK